MLFIWICYEEILFSECQKVFFFICEYWLIAASSFSCVTQLYFACAIVRTFTVAACDKIRHTNIHSNNSTYIDTITSVFIFSFFLFLCTALYFTLRNRYSRISFFFFIRLLFSLFLSTKKFIKMTFVELSSYNSQVCSDWLCLLDDFCFAMINALILIYCTLFIWICYEERSCSPNVKVFFFC